MYARLLHRESGVQISTVKRENFEDLLRDAEWLLASIESFLEFAKVKVGKAEIHIEPVKVVELLRGAVTKLEPIVDKNAVRLIDAVPATIATVQTDHEKLRQLNQFSYIFDRRQIVAKDEVELPDQLRQL